MMVKEVREGGRSISSQGNDATSREAPLMEKCLREVSLCKPHSITDLQIMGCKIASEMRLVGSPSSGKDTTLAHLNIKNSSRETMLCMQLGKASSFSHLERWSFLSLGVNNPLPGKDIRFGQLPIKISSRWLSLSNPCGKDLKFSQRLIIICSREELS
ncbi:Uncharacterized protein TCM_045144 [Theobroma cacao]|uniref:Uncharacterized protein n=1 Tax=Theobroma cacao TaxID=3641 RepID=A0A061FSW9_THECC|nr:Uncharacterized protein TCM_045144 [Theobroma cacao]